MHLRLARPPADATGMPEARPRILVVDDEPRGVELLARALHDVGEVEIATSGEDGWAIARRNPVEVVVSDQRMPGMTGVELLAHVADQDGDTGRILLTGYADLSATVDAINRGHVHAYLSKPCPPEQLRLTVQSVLDRVRLSRENAQLLSDLREKNAALETAMDDLRQAQERVVHAERLSAIGRMMAMVVHDFRGPLAVVRAAGGDVAREGHALPGDELRELGDTVREEADRMNQMCTELLETTRAGDGTAERRQGNLDVVVEAALACVAEDASLLGVRIDARLGAPKPIALDENRMRRALLNLFYNALEAMPQGGVLHVESGSEGQSVFARVADTGTGIPDSIRERLFEPFVTAGKSHGSGLGLAVVKKVVEDHGGSIDVGKPEGGGTVFRIDLPVG